MEYMEFQNIVKAIKGNVIKDGKNRKYNEVCTDTRKIEKGNIFFALKGDNYNGCDFIEEASNKGAAICIVDEVKFRKEDISENTSIILVENCKKALLDLAEYYRSILNLKVVAITGSTGKTSTKDVTAAVLSGKYNVFKTQGNFNNEIGLPLMIFSLDNSFDVAVLEMGMSNFNEIHNMTKVARPDVAMITNIGISHIENLKTKENILKAKLEITDYFSKNNVLIINENDHMLSKLEERNFKIIRTGINSKGDYSATDLNLLENSVAFKVYDKYVNNTYEVGLPIPGKHNISNALLAFACGRYFNMNFQEMISGIENLVSTSMRLDLIRNEKYTIVNDCYNASPDSMMAAIDVVKKIKGNRRIAVLGTMRELGNESYNAHEQVGKYAADNGIDILVVCGEYTKAYKDGFFKKEFYSFNNTKEISVFLMDFLNEKDVVLLKASRAMKFEYIVNKLSSKKSNI